MPHPPLETGQEDAVADRVDKEALPDALGRRMWSPRDARLCNYPVYLDKQCFSGFGPEAFIGLNASLGAADAMRRIEKFNEGGRDGDSPRDLVILKDDRLAGAIDMARCQIHGYGEIAAGVMKHVAKSPDRILRAVRSPDKCAAVFFIEKEPLSLFIE
jgi:hypothetical protein